RGQLERRPAPIGHEPAVGVLDRQLQRAAVAYAPAFREPAVSHVQGARAPAEVTEDIWPGVLLQQWPQFLQYELELGVVGGIDGDELSTRPAVCVFEVAQEDEVRAGDELEGNPPRDAVVPDGGQDALRAANASRGVDL